MGFKRLTKFFYSICISAQKRGLVLILRLIKNELNIHCLEFNVCV